MPLDTSIPLQVQTPSMEGAMKPISALLGVRQQAQQLQAGQQTIQSNAIDLGEKQAMQQVLSDPSQYTDQAGNVDWNKLTPAVMKAAPVNGPRYIQGLFAAQTQATAAKQAVQNLDTDARQQVSKFVLSLVGKPPNQAAGAIASLSQSFPELTPAVKHAMSVMAPVLQSGDPQSINDTIVRLGKSIEDPQSQQNMSTPGGIQVANGQQSSVVSTKPWTNAEMGQPIPGTEQQMQLPPTTPTVGPNNQPGYLGPQPQGSKFGTPPNILDGLLHTESGGKPFVVNPSTKALGPYQITPETLADLHKQGYPSFDPFDPKQARDAADFLFQQKLKASGGDMNKALAAYGGFVTKDPSGYIKSVTGGNSGFVPSGPVPGANESKAGTIETVNQHWKQLNDQATNAPLIQGLLGNIKSLAPGAITGAESGRKAYLNGLLNALHLGGEATGDMQKDTDLLEKNIAQLGLNTPASTDAARTLVAAARPHSTMSQGAIEEAASQLGGQVQANVAVRNALASAKSIADRTGDPTAYNQMRQHLEQIADPRAWQFQSLDAKGRAEMLRKLTPEDRNQLRSNIQSLVTEGLLK